MNSICCEKMPLLITTQLFFHATSLWLCLAALFLHVKPAQLLRFLLSSLWCRQMHQSGTLSSNYPPLAFCVRQGPAPSSLYDTDGWFNLFFFLLFCLLQAFIADNWQTIWEHQIQGNYSHCLLLSKGIDWCMKMTHTYITQRHNSGLQFVHHKGYIATPIGAFP